jgi:soluble lytic murein transglycosylase
MSPALIRAFVLGSVLLSAATAGAQDVMEAVRGDRWADAEAAVAQSPDPVARKLVSYFRMLAPGQASASEIAAFIADSPDWPQQALLARRRDEALAREPDDAVAARLCAATPPKLAGAWLRCAAAGGGAEAARQAWIAGINDAGGESAFLKTWGGALTAADQRARFDRLAWGSDTAAAQRQVLRLEGGARAAAEARLALKRDDPRATKLVDALGSGAIAGDPGLFYERVRTLRRNGFDGDAAALWASAGTAAERAAGAEHGPAFWNERNLLARRLLRNGDAKSAYALAAGHAQTALEQVADAEFFAGFIALRRLNDPARATPHFQALAKLSKALLTQSRAHYWLGRAAAAAKQDPTPEYRAAAAYPTTYYGQLAALALGDDAAALNARIEALRDPAWDREEVLDFAGREITRAAALLVAWGEPVRARSFLLRLDEVAPAPVERSMDARLALGLGMPDQAVMLARRAGREGIVLPVSGWPAPVEVPSGTIEPAVALALIRQESSFDVGAVSPSGARGLMQLMPATAQQVAKVIGEPTSTAILTADPAHNMRLGTTYLQNMLDSFGGALPLAFAAYNAGPNRTLEWLATNGDPRIADPEQPDMIDWIELIPISETRNYVQRVSENVAVYRAHRHAIAPHPVAPWLR